MNDLKSPAFCQPKAINFLGCLCVSHKPRKDYY
jgi:hypothetical protein